VPEWLALLNTAGLLLVAIVTWVGNKKTHDLVNSRMTELLDLTRTSVRAEERRIAEDKARALKEKNHE